MKRWSELTEKQQILLQIIKEKPKIFRKKLVKELNINPSAIQKRIEILKRKKLLKRIGSTKDGHWEIIE